MSLEYAEYVKLNPRYKWHLTLSLFICSMMTELNYLMVPIGLPKVMSSMGATVDSIQWVQVGYLLSSTVIMGSMGWFSEVIGYKKLYQGCVGLFTLSSGLCAFAWNVESLIFFRVLQGLGGGAIWPLGVAILVETFPHEERGTGLGVFSVGATLIPYALGPSLGGYLLEHLNWRIMFFVNLPIGVAGLLLVSFIMRDIRSGVKMSFDFPGFATLTLSLLSLLLALTQVHKEGWDSSYIISLIFICIVAFVAFVIIELKTKKPFMDLQLFKHYNFSLSMLTMVLYGVTFYAAAFLLPILLVNIMDYTVFQLGLMMVPGSILSSILLLTSGWMADRWDSRVLIGLGLVMGFLGMLMYASVNFQTSPGTIVFMQMLRGAGAGLLFIPLTKVAMRGIPQGKVGMASGYLMLLLVIGGSFGIATFNTFLEKRIAFHGSMSSDMVNLSSTGFYLSFARVKGFLLHSGFFSDGQASAYSLSMIKGMVAQVTLVRAYNDVFLLIALFALLVLVPVIIMKK